MPVDNSELIAGDYLPRIVYAVLVTPLDIAVVKIEDTESG